MTASVTPVAKVAGTEWQELPEDLYIPPDALEVFVEVFEGPLDLLLYLIRKQNLDILNIPVAEITRQYMAYIELMQELQLELAAEYLLMAALLAEIKSRLLLPRPQTAEEIEEDPRMYLIAKLREYEQIKNAAQNLDELPRQERDLFPIAVNLPEFEVQRRYPALDFSELMQAMQNVLKRAEQFTEHHIVKEPLSLKDRIEEILLRLKQVESLVFSSLFNYQEGRAGVVVSFLAILELAKEGFIEIFQAEPFAELQVQAI